MKVRTILSPLFFCWSYIAIIFFCIFLRIESWPFSDYRVFEGAHDLQRVNAYRLGLLSGAGERVWLFSGRERYKNDDVFAKVIFTIGGDPKVVEGWMRQFLPIARKKSGGKYDELVLFSQKVFIDKDKNYQINITPHLRHPL